jgi:hypothetical protein
MKMQKHRLGDAQINWISQDRLCSKFSKKDLRLFPYKIQLVQELKPVNRENRLEYTHMFLGVATQDRFISKLKLIFT